MKRISVCIVLSLVMCLCMVFPVSAAVIHKPELAERVDFYITEMLNSPYYSNIPDSYKNYYFCTYSTTSIGSFNIFLHFVNSPIITTSNKGCYRLHYQSNTNVFGYIDGTDFSVSLIPSPTNVEFVRINTLKPNKTQGYVSESQYFIIDRSTATFYNQSNVLPDVSWQIKLSPDTSALQSLINTAKSTIDTGYNSDSWQALQAQITAAESLLNTTGYTQAHVDAQTAALQSALDGLVLAPVLPDTTELQELLFEADKITDIGYTEPTWTRFSNARMAGHNLLARPTYTALDVQTATDELRSSMSGLTLASVNPPVNPPVKPPQDYPATTFESFLGSERAATYLDVSEGFSLAHLFPAVAGIEENMSEARKFAIWVFVAILGVYITTRILRTVVFVDSVDATGGHEKIFNIGMNDAKRSALASRDDLTKKERASLGSEYQGTYLRQVNIGEKYIDW